jgi:hypothetical protein
MKIGQFGFLPNLVSFHVLKPGMSSEEGTLRIVGGFQGHRKACLHWMVSHIEVNQGKDATLGI